MITGIKYSLNTSSALSLNKIQKELENFSNLIKNGKFKELENALKNSEFIKNQSEKNINLLRSLKAEIENNLLSNTNNTHIKNIKNLIDNLLAKSSLPTQKESIKTEDIIKWLFDYIKTNGSKKIDLSNFSNIHKLTSNISKELENLKKLLANNKELQTFSNKIDKFTKQINSIDLKQNIKDSGIFLESKLLDNNSQNQNIKNDLKAMLHTIKDSQIYQNNSQLQKSVNKIISDIQILQLNSIIHSNMTIFIPFRWEDLKNGSMSIYTQKKSNIFSCKIDLELKKQGTVEVMMMLSLQNEISLSFNIENSSFKDTIKKHKKELEIALKTIGLNSSIFINNKKISYNDTKIPELNMDIKA